MHRSVIFFIVTLVGFFLSSGCSDFLNIDNYFDDELKIDSIFTKTRYVEAYMWGAAKLFPDEGQIFSTGGQDALGPLATDEAFSMFNIDGSSSYSGLRFVLGYITPNNLGPFGNNYKNYYRIIRKCNIIIARIDEPDDLSSTDRLKILGYTYFFRAYAYYKILMEFGPPMILKDEIIATNESIEYYDRSRSTYDEAVEYICDEFEKAAMFLPETLPITDFGRPTKGAAYALIARIRLIHASPLFNGGSKARQYYGNWVRKSDGAYYIAQEYDEERWALAAGAAKRVMDMGLYRLYTVESDEETPNLPENINDPNYYRDFPSGAGGIDHFKSYSEVFNGESVASINPEFIWARKSPELKSYTRASFPLVYGGWNGMGLTQKMVDAFYMVDGRTIDNSSEEFPYSENGFTSSSKSFSGYRLNADVYNMYNNREMRFYASVGFSECFWPCSSATSPADNNLTISYHYDSENGKSNPNALVDHTPTGYVIKKYIHPMDAYSGTNSRVMDKVFPIIRYAEILLNYVEALNNLTEDYAVEMSSGEKYSFSRDVEEIKDAFNLIRYRAGLPGLRDPEVIDKDELHKILIKERMIEFLFENRRYYDVRRWGIYEDVENETIMGMNVDAGKEGFYQRVIPSTSRVGSRVVDRKMIFLPLPQNEIRRLPSVDQNPGW